MDKIIREALIYSILLFFGGTFVRYFLFFLRPHLCKLIAQCGQTHLLIHEYIISHFGMFCIMRYCPKIFGRHFVGMKVADVSMEP